MQNKRNPVVHFLLFFSGLLFGFSPLSAQVPTERATLWQVSGKGLAKPSYLFGTFHLLCAEDLVISPTLEEKLKESRKLFLELDFSDPQLMAQVMESMQMLGDTTLHDLYDEATYRAVDSCLQRYTHISMEKVNTMKPYGLTAAVMSVALHCTPASWETHLADMAKANQLAIGGLETVSSQAAVFDRIPYTLQAEQLKDMLFHPDSTEQDVKALIALYKSQDIQALQNRISSDPFSSPYLDLLLYNRNAHWIPLILRQAKEHPTFFAFGAGHLGGEKGVINLLRKEGYTVTPLFQQ